MCEWVNWLLHIIGKGTNGRRNEGKTDHVWVGQLASPHLNRMVPVNHSLNFTFYLLTCFNFKQYSIISWILIIPWILFILIILMFEFFLMYFFSFVVKNQHQFFTSLPNSKISASFSQVFQIWINIGLVKRHIDCDFHIKNY